MVVASFGRFKTIDLRLLMYLGKLKSLIYLKFLHLIGPIFLIDLLDLLLFELAHNDEIIN